MSEGMLGLLPLRDVRGPVDDLFEKLASAEGPKWLEGLNTFLRTSPAVQPATSSKRSHYADGEVFEMTLNPVVAPLDMVANDGYDNPSKWKHKGSVVKGTQTKKFIWVAVGYQPNLNVVRAACLEAAEKLGFKGRIPEGQWREAVKQTFGPDGEHPRGVADPSWEYPFGSTNFPYVISDGVSSFRWTDGGCSEYWRWLVEVSK